ncbi:unnamed protein product [Closterium sp. NIES-65]|nr:unnamed protein product [Closterium sp. NIES-65]
MASPAALPLPPPGPRGSSPPRVDPRSPQRQAELSDRRPLSATEAVPVVVPPVAAPAGAVGAAGAVAGGGNALTYCLVIVCLSDFNKGELIRILPPCKHQFHVACIDHWLATRTTCPVCRTDLQSPDPIVTAEDSEVTDKVEGGDNAV